LAKFLFYNVRRCPASFRVIALKLQKKSIFVIIRQPPPQNEMTNIYFDLIFNFFFEKPFGQIVVLNSSKGVCKFCLKNKKIDRKSPCFNLQPSQQKVRYKLFV